MARKLRAPGSPRGVREFWGSPNRTAHQREVHPYKQSQGRAVRFMMAANESRDLVPLSRAKKKKYNVLPLPINWALVTGLCRYCGKWRVEKRNGDRDRTNERDGRAPHASDLHTRSAGFTVWLSFRQRGVSSNRLSALMKHRDRIVDRRKFFFTTAKAKSSVVKIYDRPRMH